MFFFEHRDFFCESIFGYKIIMHCTFFACDVQSARAIIVGNTVKVITEKCKKCLECTEVCPVGAISLKDGVVTIDKDICLSCGCCASACTSEAISYED